MIANETCATNDDAADCVVATLFPSVVVVVVVAPIGVVVVTTPPCVGVVVPALVGVVVVAPPVEHLRVAQKRTKNQQ